MNPTLNNLLRQLAERQDLVLLTFMFIFVLMFIIPIPPVVIDMLIGLNISLTLVVLVTSTYLRGPSDLSTFPALILFTTVFRLAITVSTARLILSKAHAGDIIQTFGNFVVAGNVLIGIIVFFIVAIVQFIVVVKGAERIAEVGARFTLDALPGKQMSIDSDLRNGDITKEEARAKRSRLEKDSAFFGAMDGAMRFVKGDAIAGFVVIFVNLIGGIMVGMFTKGMSFNTAVNTFSLLTVGEGLVAQIPAMFVAIAAGIVSTRVSSEDSRHLGGDIARELSAQTRPLYIAAVVMVIIGFLPGFPKIVFFSLAALIAGMAYMVTQRREEARVEEETRAAETKAAEETAAANKENEDGEQPAGTDAGPAPRGALTKATPGDIYVLAVPPDLYKLWEDNGVAKILRQASQRAERELGLKMPEFSVREDSRQLPNAYQIEVEDVPVYRGEFNSEVNYVTLAPNEVDTLELYNNSVTDSQITNLYEVPLERREAIREAGHTIKTAYERLGDEAEQSYIRYATRSFGINEASQWLDGMEGRYSRLVGEVKSNVPMLKLVEIGRRLLDENVGMGQPRVMLESLLQANAMDLDATDTVELVRRALSRQIVWRYTNENGELDAILIEPAAESIINDIVTKSPADLAGTKTGEQLSGLTFARSLAQVNQEALSAGMRPVLLTSAPIRPMARMMLTRNGVQIPVISFQEIGNDVQVRPMRAMSPQDLGLD